MNLEPKSIAEHIECLARLTGAPDSFVVQVRGLFSRKGISLTSDATPYLKALDEAFRREETIRANVSNASAHIGRSVRDFNTMGKNYVKQLEQLKHIRSNTQDQSRRLRTPRATPGSGKTSVTVPGDHRTFVTRPQQERLPMVPGPKDIQ